VVLLSAQVDGVRAPPRWLVALGLTLLTSGGVLALTRQLPETPLAVALLGARFELLTPRALQLAALVPWLLWASTSSLVQLSRARRLSALLLRSAGVLVGALALAQPLQRVETHDTATVFVVDVSDSIDETSLADARAYIARALAQRSATRRASLLTFAAEASARPLPAPGAETKSWALARHASGRGTDVERALSLALGSLPADVVPQVVLFSDGRETHGDRRRALDALEARGALLFVKAPGVVPSEVGVLDLTLPSTIRVGEPFMVEARVVASAAMEVHAKLLVGERDNEPDSERTLHVEPGETTLSFRSRVGRAGHVRYTLELTPGGPDRFVENNRFVTEAVVRGAPRVLVIAAAQRAYAFVDLLRAASFEVELSTPERAPASNAALRELDFYVLCDVPRVALSRASLDAIVAYVHDGGGFLMTGGEHSFGLGGYQGSPLEPILPVLLEGSAQRDQPSLALVLAIDKSGSMAGDKLERAKEAAIATAELLSPDSYLGVIGFDAEPERIVRLALRNPSAVARNVGLLAAGGGTALFPALDAAYSDLSGVRARKKHVVVLTDGQTQEESLDALAENMRADDISVSTIGLGEDVNRGLLVELATRAGGRSYFTRDPARIPRLFTDEAELVARSSAVEARTRVRRVLPADFLKGIAIEGAPPLSGYVATRARPAPAQLILDSQRGEPVLSRQRVGLGWSLALTTDVEARWSADWYRWRPLSALFAQLIREHMRQARGPSLPVHTRLEGDVLVASVDVLDERGRFVDDLRGQLLVENDRGLSRTIELLLRSPGRYEARVTLTELGSYVLRARLERAADERTSATPHPAPGTVAVGQVALRPALEPLTVLAEGSLSVPFPAEYRPPFAPETGSLRAAAQRTGGGDLPAPERLLPGRGRHAWSRRERWPALVWAVLALFLMDLVTRRVRLPTYARRQGT
jgi:Ca-activated chloride channel family protein